MGVPTYRNVYKWCFYLVILIFIFDAFLQYYLNIDVCVLGYIERLIFLFLAIAFLAAKFQLHTPTTKKVYDWIILILSFLGIITAGRHVWLQHYPSSITHIIPTTGNSQLMRFLTVIKNAYLGTAGCEQVKWAFADISLATWMLFAFIIFAIIAFVQSYRKSSI